MQNLRELNHCKDVLKHLHGVTRFTTDLWVGIKNIPENLSVLLPEKKSNKNGQRKKQKEKIGLKRSHMVDKVDNQIVNKLTINGRQSFSRIANEIGTSVSTISRRYNKMRNNQVIKSVLQINPRKLGYKACIIVYLSVVSKMDTDKITDLLAKIPDVCCITQISGDHDFMLKLMIRSIDDFLSIQNSIQKIQNISKIQIWVYKVEDYYPLPQEPISTI